MLCAAAWKTASECSECDSEKEMSMSGGCELKEYNEEEENEEEMDQPLLTVRKREV